MVWWVGAIGQEFVLVIMAARNVWENHLQNVDEYKGCVTNLGMKIFANDMPNLNPYLINRE